MSDAHTRIFHEWLGPLFKIPLTGIQMKLIFWVARNSYGWKGARQTKFSWRVIASDLGSSRPNVMRQGKKLIDLGILVLSNGELSINKYKIMSFRS